MPGFVAQLPSLDGLTTITKVFIVLITLIFLKWLAPWLRVYWKTWRLNCSLPIWCYPYDVTGYFYARETSKAQQDGILKQFTLSNFNRLGVKSFMAVRAGRRTLYTRDPRIAQFVFSTAFEDFGVGPFRGETRDAFVGPGISTVDGKPWHVCHDTLRPFWHVAQVGDLSVFAPHVERFVAHIQENKGNKMDLAPLLTKLWLDASTELLLGESTSSLDPGAIQDARTDVSPGEFIQAFNEAMAGVGKRLARGRWNAVVEPFGFDSRWMQACERSRTLVDRYIDRAFDAKSRGFDFNRPTGRRARLCLIDELVKQTDDKDFIRGQVVNVFLPARANAMRGSLLVLFFLARHPRCWAKVRNEAFQFRSVDDIKVDGSSKYTENCIYEALRQFTPNTRTLRSALRDVVIPYGGGPNADSPIFMQEEDTVLFETAALHADRDIRGEDATEYKPERWEGLQRSPWEYLAFAGGPRVCPAERLIVTQYTYLLLRMAWTFETLKNCDQDKQFVEEWKRLGLDSRNGLQVAFG